MTFIDLIGFPWVPRIKANNPVASLNANPKMAYEKSCALKEGFLASPKIKAPNTTPIPTPAPIFFRAYKYARENLLTSCTGTGAKIKNLII